MQEPTLKKADRVDHPDAADITSLDDVAMAGRLTAARDQIINELRRIIVGQDEVIEQLLISLFVGGNSLIVGVPGLAKTLLVQTLAEVLDLDFSRIQFTPDLMPSDITGTDIIQENPETGKRGLTFMPGPIFANIVLADEINRTPPKTQAALLEAMQEHRVTIGQQTYQLEEPFFVLATQNPIEQEGTYPLPEAQKDRFIFQILVSYPDREEEREIIRRTTGSYDYRIKPVLSGEDIIQAQKLVRKVPVPDHVTDYVLDLVRATRPKEKGASRFVRDMVDWGAGPRACQHLIIGGKVRALLRERTHVTLDDVIALAHPVLRHRLVPTFNAEAEGISVEEIIDEILDETPTGEAARVL